MNQYTYKAVHEDGTVIIAGTLKELENDLGLSVQYLHKSIKEKKARNGWTVTKRKNTSKSNKRVNYELEKRNRKQYEVVNTRRGKVEYRNTLEHCAEYIGFSQSWTVALLNKTVKHRTYELREG